MKEYSRQPDGGEKAEDRRPQLCPFSSLANHVLFFLVGTGSYVTMGGWGEWGKGWMGMGGGSGKGQRGGIDLE